MQYKNSITKKTFLFTSVLISFLIAVSFLMLYFVMPGYYLSRKTKLLDRNVQKLTTDLQLCEDDLAMSREILKFSIANNATVLAFEGEGELVAHMSSPFLIFDRQDELLFIFERPSGLKPHESGFSVRLESWEATPRGDFDITTAPAGEARPTFARAQGAESIAISAPLAAGLPASELYITTTLQPIDEAGDVVLSLIPIVLPVCIAAGCLIVWFYIRRITLPIVEISRAAVDMRSLTPGITSGIRTADEIGELSENLDNLYGELCENIDELACEMKKVSELEQARTAMFRSAGHELKTPIAALSGMLDGMLDGVGVYNDREKYLLECKMQTEKLSRLVNEILEASRTETPIVSEPEAVDIAELAGAAVREFESPAFESDREIFSEFESFTATGDSEEIYRVFTNLLSNAVRYSLPGTRTDVRIKDGKFSIENSAPEMPDEDWSRLFEPFFTRSYSRDHSESGTGLGLFIVKNTLEKAGFPFEFTRSGDRVKFEIDFAADKPAGRTDFAG